MKTPCPYLRVCPGCKVMQFPYVKQLRDKELALRKTLAAVLNEPTETVFRPIVPSPAQLGYRTSTKLVMGEDDFGEQRVGLFEKASKKVAHIPDCPVHHPEINKLLWRLLGPKAPPLPARFYKHHRRQFQAGLLKFVTLRYCPDTRAAAVLLSHTGVPRGLLEEWAYALKINEVSLYEGGLGPNDHNTVIPKEAFHLAGPTRIPFTIGNGTFWLGPLAFFQANWSLTSTFVDAVVAGLNGKGLLDLYGGFGAYSFALKEHFQTIKLVDGNPHAIEAAQFRVKAENAQHIMVVESTVEAVLAMPQRAAQNVTDMIVNPPRSGLSPKVRGLLKDKFSHLRSLTYVSCNPSTLARDLQDITVKMPLKIATVTPFDMFPQTEHLESIVRLHHR